MNDKPMARPYRVRVSGGEDRVIWAYDLADAWTAMGREYAGNPTRYATRIEPANMPEDDSRKFPPNETELGIQLRKAREAQESGR